MMKRLFFLSFTIFFLSIPFLSLAGKLSGKITDSKGEALSFATVYVQGTTMGTTANEKGQYEIQLQPGTYKVICQYIGFKQSVFTVTIQGEETIQHNFSLQYQSLDMQEVVIHANTEDPAYPIIRKAIGRRKFHLQQVKSFQTAIYLKGVFRTRQTPTELFGQKVDNEEIGLDQAGKGILYLCEENADYYSEEPDRRRTVIHSVIESGNPNGYGFSQLPSVITFYENNIPLFTPRGFISPISDNALSYYKYKLLGQFEEGSHTIYKIKVIPKRLYEPLFNGTIYIVDGDWAIHSLDMFVTKTSNLETLDTLQIKQLFLPQKKDTWVIKSQVIFLTIGILGFDATGNFVTVYDKQKVNEPIPDTVFNRNVISTYDKAANKKDSTYWKDSRPIPLEADEKKDYVVKDSIRHKEEDPHYKDSLRRIGNKVSAFNLLFFGYTYTTKGYKDVFTINPIIVDFPGNNNMLNYNIVEGMNIAPKITWRHPLDTGKYLTGAMAARYGFSNTHFNAIARLGYVNEDRYWKGRSWEVGVQGGKYVFQYNPDNPIWPIYNTVAALFYHENDLKIYERWDGTVYFKRNFGNGLKFDLKASTQERLPLENTTDYSFTSHPADGFTSNIPSHLQSVTVWEKHDAVLLHAGISYQPGYTYTQYPDYKVSNGSRWPVFSLSYDKGIPDILNSKVDFDKWRVGVRDNFSMKLLGVIKYNIAAGGFLNSNYVSIPDLMHLYGNRGIGYAAPYLTSFQFAQYYDFSNKEPLYGEAHIEYHMDGLISNKIPLLRQARWYLLMGTNTFYARQNDYYSEAFIGIDNIGWKFIRFLRVDFVQSWDSKGGTNSGIRFGVNASGLLSLGLGNTNATNNDWEW